MQWASFKRIIVRITRSVSGIQSSETNGPICTPFGLSLGLLQMDNKLFDHADKSHPWTLVLESLRLSSRHADITAVWCQQRR